MKIKILKDIPGYKAGEIFDWGDGLLSYTHSPIVGSIRHITYNKTELVNLGFAEEVKDEIDKDCKHARKFSRPNTNNFEFFCDDCGHLMTPQDRPTVSPTAVLAAESIINSEEIDIQAIREKYINIAAYAPSVLSDQTLDDKKFYQAYLIVKAVIEKLNGEWQVDWSVYEKKWAINIQYAPTQKVPPVFQAHSFESTNPSLIPLCRNSTIALKVMEICKPELEVLFGVK